MRTNLRVTGVIIRDNKILLIHRYKQDKEYWVFPGGGVEEGESLEAALRREILEETGLGITSYEFLYRTSNNPECYFYSCELEPGEPKLGGPELAEQSPDNQHILEWVDFDKLFNISPIFPKPDPTISLLPKRKFPRI